MNLHEIDKPFGELDDATKGALLLAAHNGAVIEGHPATTRYPDIWISVCNPNWQQDVIYRVRPPAPVVVAKTFHGVMDMDFHILSNRSKRYYGHDATRATFTFPTIDGKHIAGVYTSPAGHTIKIEVVE